MPAVVPSSPPERDDATTEQLVRVGAWTVMLAGTTIAALLLLDRPLSWTQVLLNLGAGAMGGLAVFLGHLQRWRQAALVLIWGVWAMVSVVAANNGGLRGPNLLNFPVLIVFSGWILGARPTLLLTGATGGLFLFFVWADLYDWLPPARYSNRLAYVAYLGAILAVTAAATLLSRRSYLRRVQEARLTATNLAAVDAELRKLQRAVEQSPRASSSPTWKGASNTSMPPFCPARATRVTKRWASCRRRSPATAWRPHSARACAIRWRAARTGRASRSTAARTAPRSPRPWWWPPSARPTAA